jgi:hypothetical protein
MDTALQNINVEKSTVPLSVSFECYHNIYGQLMPAKKLIFNSEIWQTWLEGCFGKNRLAFRKCDCALLVAFGVGIQMSYSLRATFHA